MTQEQRMACIEIAAAIYGKASLPVRDRLEEVLKAAKLLADWVEEAPETSQDAPDGPDLTDPVQDTTTPVETPRITPESVSERFGGGPPRSVEPISRFIRDIPLGTDEEAIFGRDVVVYWGTGAVKAIGRVVAYQQRPTVTIDTEDGQIHWTADLVYREIDLKQCYRRRNENEPDATNDPGGDPTKDL